MRMPKRRASGGPSARALLIGWLGLLLFWFVLVGQLQPVELAAGAAAATLSTYAWRTAGGRSGASFRLRLRWLAHLWRIPVSLVQGTWAIFGVLAQQLLQRRPAPSLFVSVPFDAGGDDPASAARRALAVAYVTVTPAFVVVGIDRERGRLVYHQIQPRAVLGLPAELGVRR